MYIIIKAGGSWPYQAGLISHFCNIFMSLVLYNEVGRYEMYLQPPENT